MKKISNKEWESIALALLSINPLFHDMWRRWDTMRLDADVETVQLDTAQTKDGGTNFRIVANPKYWRSQTNRTKLFIICHEMCHAMFGHFVVHPKLDTDWVNIAQDMQVNEYLFTHYFKKEDINDSEIATIDSVFRYRAKDVPRQEGYMYYYNILMTCLK